MPYLLETAADGVKQTEKIQIDSITVNPKLHHNIPRCAHDCPYEEYSSCDLSDRPMHLVSSHRTLCLPGHNFPSSQLPADDRLHDSSQQKESNG